VKSRAGESDRQGLSFAYRIQKASAAFVVVTERALFWLSSALLVFLVVALFLQVLFRYVIGQPLEWSEEGARFALVWLSIAAACIAAIEGQHFIFRYATLVLPVAGRFWLRRVIDVMIIMMLVLVLKLSLDYLDVVAHQTASGTGLNMRVPYAAISFGAVVLILIHFAELLDAAFFLKTGQILSRREQHEKQMMQLLRGSR